MRTQVIPAQITTVEDRIAGNFSLKQILILLTPAFFATIIFVVFPPTMIITWLKMGIISAFGLVSTTLAIRIKGKLIIDWIVVLLKYNIRPKYYVFNKNGVDYRDLVLPNKEKVELVKAEKTNKAPEKLIPSITIQNLIQLENLIHNKDFDVRFTTAKKGGLNVAFEKIVK